MNITKTSRTHDNIPRLIRIGLPVLLLACCGSPLMAQKIWQVNDGAWTVPGNWNGGVPAGTTSANEAVFQISTASPNAAIEVTLDNSAHEAGAIRAGLGKSVTLEMADGASLTTGPWWRVGENIGDGSGSGHVTVNGPETGGATISAGFFHVGSSALTNGGNTLTFSGNLTVTDNATSTSVIGRVSDNNTLTVSQGASVTRHALTISPSNVGAGRINNGLVVDGTGSAMIIDGGALSVGNTAESRSNYVTVTNNGTVEVKLSQALLIGATSGFGGNHVTMSNGGTLITTGTTTILGFTDNSGDNDGDNRLNIQSGGTYSSSGTTNVTGLLQLAAGGALTGNATVSLNPTGRFEAAGTGLADTVTTNINDGTLAIGLTGAVAASELTLNSVVNFSGGATLELTLFSSAADGIDRVVFGVDGGFNLAGTVSLDLVLSGYVPVPGDSWTVFSGNTTGIGGVGQFDTSGLDPTVWNTNLFNEAGGWQLSVIPEPSTLALFGIALACLGYGRSRKRSLPENTRA